MNVILNVIFIRETKRPQIDSKYLGENQFNFIYEILRTTHILLGIYNLCKKPNMGQFNICSLILELSTKI